MKRLGTRISTTATLCALGFCCAGAIPDRAGAESVSPQCGVPAAPLLVPDPADGGLVPFWALVFDGVDDRASACGTNPFDGLTAITQEVWVRQTGQSGYWRAIWMMNAYGTGITIPGANQYGYSLTTSGGNATGSLSSASYLGAWVHIALRWSSGSAPSITTYRNGVVAKNVSSAPLTGAIVLTGTPKNTFGFSDLGSGANCIAASLFGAKLWNRALSDEELAASRMDPFYRAPGLLQSNPMRPGNGQAGEDLSGNGRFLMLGSTAGVDTDDPAWSNRNTRVGSAGPD